MCRNAWPRISKRNCPRPDDMKPDVYRRNLAARAFDVARYLLPFGIPTGVGQVTSIRTLEKQIRRFKASEFQELRDIGHELAAACAATPDCIWHDDPRSTESVAPTLARHAEPDEYTTRLRADLSEWATDHLPKSVTGAVPPRRLTPAVRSSRRYLRDPSLSGN